MIEGVKCYNDITNTAKIKVHSSLSQCTRCKSVKKLFEAEMRHVSNVIALLSKAIR